MEVNAVIANGHVAFTCPSCNNAYAWNADVPSAQQPQFPVSCEQCGVTFSVRNGSLGAATSPLVGATATAPAPDLAEQIGQRVSASAADAFDALRKLTLDPVGALASAYQAIGEARAQAAGVALAAAFAISATLGSAIGARRALGGLLAFGGGLGFGDFVKMAFGCLVFPAAMMAIAFGVRKVLQASAPVAADIFTCGAALSPLGLAFLLAGILGGANLEIILVLLLFAAVYLSLILFAGLTRIGGLSERAAAPAVPVVVLLTGWLAKVVFAALL